MLSGLSREHLWISAHSVHGGSFPIRLVRGSKHREHAEQQPQRQAVKVDTSVKRTRTQTAVTESTRNSSDNRQTRRLFVGAPRIYALLY